MSNSIQLNVFETSPTPIKKAKKMYTVQKYKLSYVKEDPSFPSHKIVNKSDVTDFCKKFLSDIPVENVCIIALDNSNSIIGFDAIEGATNQCAVYPSNCFRFLLSAGASSFIVAHNHPGGTTAASHADWTITKRLKDAGSLLDIPLLDHLIVTEDTVVSLRENSKWENN